MKLAFVNPEYPPVSGCGHGGIATTIYTMCSTFARMGHEVHLFLRDGTVPDLLPDSVKIHFYGYTPSSKLDSYFNRFRKSEFAWEKGHSRTLYQKLRALAGSDGLDIVEFAEFGGLAHQLKAPLPFGCCIHFHTPTELVDELNHTMATRGRKMRYRLEREALMHAHSYKTQSYALQKDVCKRYRIPETNIAVIRNPIDTSIFDKIEKIHSREDRIEILFVGRLECRKGAEIILRSIKMILGIDPRVNITFVGETDIGDAQSYRNAIERMLAAEERVRVWFLGAIDRKELPLLYCRSSIFLIPSLFDNAPNTLFEAMAAKLPIVAADVGGINEIIKHGENGLLFPADNTERLIECLTKYINEPAVGAQFAENAYNDIRDVYNSEFIARQTYDYYQGVLQKLK